MSESKLAVLHIIDHLALGGAQTAVKTYIKYRPQDRVFVLRQNKFQEKEFTLANSQILNKGVADRKEGYKLIFTLIAIIHKYRFRIIHCHLFNSFKIGMLIKKIYGKRLKVLFHERGKIMSGNENYIKRIQKYADKGKFIAVSQFMFDRLISAGIPEEKIFLLYNGIDLNYFHPRKKRNCDFLKRHGIPRDKFVIGFAGRFMRIKGCLDFINAVAEDKGNGIVAVMAGSGKRIPEVQGFIKGKKLEQKIFVIGAIANMLEFYHAIDCMVVPSWLEPMGRVQLEAQACGVPVAGTNVKAINETISSNNAMMVPYKNPIEIQKAIMRIRQDTDLKNQLIRAGLENVKRFDLRNHLDKLQKIYEDL